MVKIVPKRTKLLQKLAYVLRPFVVYMLVKTLAMLTFAIVIPSLPIEGISVWVEQNSSQLSAVVNGAASLIAAGFLLNDFLIEVDIIGEVDIDKKAAMQFLHFMRTDFWGGRGTKKTTALVLCTALGITSSFALNILIELLMIHSEKYDTVEEIQYSVPVWLGLILYGLISPMVEEMVFRGVIYNRIQKFFGVFKAVVFSALLFGLFHGNLLQFLYGTAMGIVMAVCYECAGCFAAPVLVHISANSFIFLLSGFTAETIYFMTPFWCAVFMILSAVLIWGIGKCKIYSS